MNMLRTLLAGLLAAATIVALGVTAASADDPTTGTTVTPTMTPTPTVTEYPESPCFNLVNELDSANQTIQVWVVYAHQLEDQVALLRQSESNLYWSKGYWMDKAFKRKVTIDRLRAELRELR